MGLLFTKRIPCNENEHLYAIENELDSVTFSRSMKMASNYEKDSM